MSNIFDLIMNLEPDSISGVIIESVFLTLKVEFKENIEEIIKGLIDFLKKENMTNSEIRIALKKFFLMQKDYIFIEFGMKYTSIGELVEKILVPSIDQSKETDSEESKESDSTESSNLHVDSNSEQTPNTNPTQYNIFNDLFTNEFTQNYYNTNPIHRSTEDVLNSLFGVHTQTLQVPNVQQNIPYFNLEYIQQPVLMQYQVDQLVGNFGLALNMFNIILQDPVINNPVMDDVKNVINSEELSKLPLKTLEEVDNEKHKTCPICLDNFDKESQLRILNCDHSFHQGCIDKWLTDCDYKCPVCRDDSNKHHAEV